MGASAIGVSSPTPPPPPPPHEPKREATDSVDGPSRVLVLLGRNEGVHAVAAKCTYVLFSYPIGLGSNYPSLLNNFPEPLGSSIDTRELVLQCMIAFDMMIRQ